MKKTKFSTSTRAQTLAATATVAATAATAAGYLVYRNGDAWLRSSLLYLSRMPLARRMVTRFPPAWAVASRFVAGESVDEAIATARQLNAKGMLVTLDYLGESITVATEAGAARDQILYLLQRIHANGVDAYVSVKLSQLGLKIDENLAIDNLRALLTEAKALGLRVRIDMEESALVDTTLDVYRRLRFGEGFENVGVVIQSSLYRSEEDVRKLVKEGAWVRLVKGAYKEPPAVAYPQKHDVDAAFVRLAELLLALEAGVRGVYLAAATHDEAMIEAVQRYVAAHDIARDAFEFQMLYGIRREWQEQLVAQGYRVRIYVPYGTAWYPYFMRRLAERPANLWFFVNNFFRA
ncbi:proline dehydrogenase family protein [Caldilinea sp.]|uniref:proline dehydrogenase family protein n=1 Tax=Caldilinea sp. TaxID=2293560 RepID=UPI002C7D81C3|nr:proline dehydrogenase family protein [Caldilinea sp.]HRA66488.1 proline dehydrogenase family protein [Caldilinea sp.]